MSNRFFVNISKDAGNALSEHYDGLYSLGAEGYVPEAPTDGKYYFRFNGTWSDSSNVEFDNVKVIESDSNLPSTSDNDILYLTLDLHKIWVYLDSDWVQLNTGSTAGVDNIINVADSTNLPSTAPPNILYITHDELKLYQYSDGQWKVLNSGGSGYILPTATDQILGGIKTGLKDTDDTQAVHVDENGALWTIPGSGGGQPTDIESTDFEVGGSNYSRTIDIKTGGLVTNQFANNSITTPKIAPGAYNQVLRTITNTESELITSWTAEQDISGKADKFTYTPDKGTETLYNLTDIQSIKVEGNGAGVNPNTGIVYTNFAGEQTIIPIQSDAGFFHYQGQVKTYERLPEFDNIKNGDLYSIYGPISYQGEVALVGDLPTNYTEADDLKQYYINSVKEYRYWSQPTSADTGSWITNHCQTEQGCDDTGYYAFGIGDTPSWNRLDSELSVDQVLDITSHNAIANSAVTEGLELRVTYEDANETLDYCINNIFPTPE
jgi:hypothetical protein